MAKSTYKFKGSELENWMFDYLNDNGNIKSDASKVNSFLKELYKMISDDFKMISLPDDGQAVLYAGWHSDVAMWQLVDCITEQTDNYYYISDTPAGMLMGKEKGVFQELLIDIIGKDYVDKLFNSNTKEFSDEALEGIINFNDYVSKNLAEKYVGNDGNALIFVSDYNPESVLIRTELPILLQKESVKTINGIPKESLIAYCEMFADVDNELAGYQKVVEVLSNVSENYLADTKILVITDAQKTELITQYGEDAVNKILSKMNIIVDTSEWADGTDVSVNGIGNNADIYKAIKEFTSVNNKNSGVKNKVGLNLFIEFEENRTYSKNSAGELIYDVMKVPEGYTSKEWLDLVYKSDAWVWLEDDLLEEYPFLLTETQTEIDKFRMFEYCSTKGLPKDNIISYGIMSNEELLKKYRILIDCGDSDLRAYRSYEYLLLQGASDDVIRKTGILPDADLIGKHSILTECLEADIEVYRAYEYLVSTGASDDIIRKTGLMPDSDLKIKHQFLNVCGEKELNAYRNYEYIKSIGANDDIVRKMGFLPDYDLIEIHSFLSESIDVDRNVYRAYEYLKSIGASDDLIRATGLMPDSDIKFKYEFLSDCTDTDILNRFRNYEYISANNIATTTADVMSEMNIYIDTNGKLISLIEASSTDIPKDFACKVTLGNASHFLLDDVMESTYSFYKDLSAPEKIKFKEHDYLTRCTKLHLDKINISDATMNKYLAATGKTADSLNVGDRCFMKMADAIASGDVDTVKYINKLADSCKGISKMSNAIVPLVDDIGTFAIAGISIYNADTSFYKYVLKTGDIYKGM